MFPKFPFYFHSCWLLLSPFQLTHKTDIDKGKSLFNMNCAACHKLTTSCRPALAVFLGTKVFAFTLIRIPCIVIWRSASRRFMRYTVSVMTLPKGSVKDIDNILAQPLPSSASSFHAATTAAVETISAPTLL